ncbi:hypothetical protein MPSEU_001051300 [Mayamaea pseudoterrestris]|nr:hypothetical protein MPSEU_001051300 [Mayamaea pseudoterrestris]
MSSSANSQPRIAHHSSLKADETSRRDFFAASFAATATFMAFGVDEASAKDVSMATSLPTTDNVVIAAPIDWTGILEKSKKKALGGGKAGASAAVVQVMALMWLRTSMNYQYRYGGSLKEALDTLWKQGGISRLYQGLPFALVQGPATRFGDTAANTGILTLLDALPATHGLPLPIKTACGSAAAGLWRIMLMPIDSSKTAMQVEGAQGLTQLWASVLSTGPGPLYRGALAQAAATAVGHFPWFITYNALNENVPTFENDLFLTLVRSAGLGLVSSCVSDCVSNSLRVIKTTKQTAQLGTNGATAKELSYPEIVASIIEQDGVSGLFLRGLSTRLLTNAIQGAAFSVLWRYFQQVG